MAQKTITVGTAGTPASLDTNFGNAQDNFTELYASKHTAETTTTIGTLVNGATAKTAPVDADMMPLMDSEASNVIKKFSWASLKTALSSLFAAALGADDNYVTDAEKVVIGNTSGTNTGDQTTIVADEIDVSTDGGTLTAAQLSRTILNNDGQTTSSNVAKTCPTLVAGLSFNIFMGTALDAGVTWSLTVPSGSSILLNGVMGSNNGTLTLTAPSVGDLVSCATFTSNGSVILKCESNDSSVTGT